MTNHETISEIDPHKMTAGQIASAYSEIQLTRMKVERAELETERYKKLAHQMQLGGRFWFCVACVFAGCYASHIFMKGW